MKLMGRMWIPDYDEHFLYPDKPIYQKSSFKAAMKHVRKFDCAVDIGAHIGFFSLYMSERFKRVDAFEPHPDNFECLQKNVPENVTCWNHGIAERDMLGNLTTPADYNSGAWEFMEDSFGTTVMMQLGAALAPDFIKIDVQGSEKRALMGCKEVIERDRPVLLVECKRGDAAFNYLKSICYRVAERTGNNMTWVHE